MSKEGKGEVHRRVGLGEGIRDSRQGALTGRPPGWNLKLEGGFLGNFDKK